MAEIDITSDQLKVVLTILSEYAPGFQAKAFGSRVTGKAGPRSDLDLVLMTSEPLSLLKLAEIREAFSESELPFRVDVVDWAGISESFRKIIDARAVRIR